MKFMPAGPLCTIFAGKLFLLLNMADREDLARLLSSAVSRAISETLSAQDSSQQSEVRIPVYLLINFILIYGESV